MKHKYLITQLVVALIMAISSISRAYVSDVLTEEKLAHRGEFNTTGKIVDEMAHWMSPLPLQYPISSCYGPRKLLNKFYDYHEGVDFAAPANTSVLAVAGGKVLWIGDMGCAGKGMIIRHKVQKRTVFSLYKHLADFKVKVGDKVRIGQRIALSGASGRPLNVKQKEEKRGCVLGPHLHIEVRMLREDLKAKDADNMLKKTGGHLADTVLAMDPSAFIGNIRKRCYTPFATTNAVGSNSSPNANTTSVR